ncbi:MAG TPA: isoprenylcysteine carboxylmethyltransferase family protein [Gammaproteobacteria bacterium]|nr:isoprenylcysteine carboxylmethyltransferase family protein [Gammaproteobacteria bacterium]
MSEDNTQQDNPGIRLPPPLYYLIGLLVGYGIYWLLPVRLSKPGYRLIVYTLGASWILLAVLLIGWALRTMRKAGTSPNPMRATSALALDEPYTLSRNPIYLGMAMLCIGISLMANMLWPLLSVPVVMVIMDRMVIRKEEQYLEAKFGDEYLQYKKRVRRWI